MADADLDVAVRQVVTGALSFNGQRCTGLKLTFIHASHFEGLDAQRGLARCRQLLADPVHRLICSWHMATARRVALKMGRRLRCSSVTYRFRYAPSSRLADGPF
jgi:hypothetical protein